MQNPSRLTHIVDIGCNPIDSEPPYASMLRNARCMVTGFDPRARPRDGSHAIYHPMTIGDGEKHTLHITASMGCCSILEPDPNTIKLFNRFDQIFKVTDTQPVQTHRLDSLDLVADMLKLDCQGSELMILQNAAYTLVNVVCVQLEVSFIPLYKNQPPFSSVDALLRQHGMVLHTFKEINRRMIYPGWTYNPNHFHNQWVEADVVYVRDFTRPDDMSDEQLMHLALIAEGCYESHDLAANCRMNLEKRGHHQAAVAPRRDASTRSA